ncbi:Maf family protein [Ancylobacter sp. 6x-1]|uniref:Nucleoside triphosphate pyrophosphatase n=1 Tax=Ancylobacter crimeensis TaxID=2579147 RepID=A0ABT0DC08_9HYPH|nr:Maf family protein [Ancylobacter crimeensis]MCK0197493.1 Maf family protein [Ancylobacter crimeensis]
MLASKSAARRALLDAARIPFEVVVAAIDERAVEEVARAQGSGPKQVAVLLAREKALSAAADHPGRLVLGADQTLAFGEEAFHKPESRAAGRAQLQRLSGATHELHSAIALARDGEIVFSLADSAHLTMRVLTPEVIDTYLDAVGDAILTSVGGYQLEGLGIHLFEKVEGAHSTILGLPLLPLLAFLRHEGALI